MAKLKVIINDLVEVPGNMREFYSTRADGRWELSLDGEPSGFVPKATHESKLTEFRDNNRALNTSKTELEGKLKAFEGLDPVAARAAVAKLATFDGIDPEEYRALKARPDVTKRVTELEAELATEKAARVDASKLADTAVFEKTIGAEFVRCGGRVEATPLEITLAEKVFKMKDGQLTTTVFSTERPGELLTVSEFIAAQIVASPYLFLPSSGGGATGGSRGGGGGKRTIGRDPLEFGKNIEAIAKGEVTVS